MTWYDAHAAEIAARYEALDPRELHAWMADLLPGEPSLVVDVGAGSGQDAAWFADAGHEVIAAEPSAGMRAEGRQRHDASRVRWIEDSLPSLVATLRLGIAADIVLVSAVWQHVAPGDRARAFRKLVTLLGSGGLLIMTLRQGSDDGRGFHAVTGDEVERLARDHGLEVVRRIEVEDALGRPEVRWTNVALRLPDDGTGALPLLRRFILLDAKSATYKLGLLRALCRAADGSAGLAEDDGQEHVVLPLGLVALNWIRLYLPLTAADLPQTPGNRRGSDGLGFAGPGWQALASRTASSRDLRVGVTFAGGDAKLVLTALREAADHIRDMPAKYLTHQDGTAVFRVVRHRLSPPGSTLTLDRATLASLGTMRVPRVIWRAMQLFAVWIEPALVAEWIRHMRDYADRQDRRLDEAKLAVAMTWSDPDRNTGVVRDLALEQIGRGEATHCVWSGKRLGPSNLDIDHCLPWSAWPCGDLWNLVPSDREVNQRGKRDRLPSAETMRTSADAMKSWWTAAYLGSEGSLLTSQFQSEALTSLPGLTSTDVDGVYAAVGLQRLRLRRNQGVPEWTWRKQ